MPCTETPASNDRASPVEKCPAIAEAERTPLRAKPAGTSGCGGTARIDDRTACDDLLPWRTIGPKADGIASTRPDRGMRQSRPRMPPPRRRGRLRADGRRQARAGAVAHRGRRGRNDGRTATPPRADGRRSRRHAGTPGRVSSSVRQPPPAVGAPSRTITRRPAAARTTAADETVRSRTDDQGVGLVAHACDDCVAFFGRLRAAP